MHYEVDRAIATITLDSPENRNALSAALVDESPTHLRAAAADDARPRSRHHPHRTDVLRRRRPEGAGGRRRPGARARSGCSALLRTIVELPKPVIARVDGNVRAGGIGLVGACDIAARRTGHARSRSPRSGSAWRRRSSR